MKKILILAALILLTSSNVFAQATTIITDTSAFVFAPSADHNSTFAGTPVLTNYSIEFFTKANVSGGVPSGAPVFNPIIGKPTPVSGEIVTAAIKTLAPLLPNAEYVWFVRATGPGGSTRSGAGVPFGFPAAPAAATGMSIR